MSTELAIIIPAKNEEKNIVNLLLSLAYQSYNVSECPIILADAHSTDQTRSMASLMAAGLNFVDFQIIDGGLPAVGRNAGAKLVNTRYVLFLDADIQLRDPTLIERAIMEMRAKGLHCVTTDIFCPQGDWKAKTAYHINNLCQRLSKLCSPFSTGMFMLFNKKIFDQLKGFREDAMFAEDYMLSKQVKCSRFLVVSGGIETSDRRFKKMGYWKLAKLFFGTAIFSFRDKQFTKDHGYWLPMIK